MSKKDKYVISHGNGDYADWEYDTLEAAIEILKECVAVGHKSTLKYRPKQAK